DEVYSYYKERLNKDKTEDLSFVSLKKYQDAIVEELRETVPKHKIAVIFAQGPIQSGEGDSRMSIGSGKMSRQIRKVRKDSTIDAVVLRVTSPGGSALASDVIWRETILTADKKPFIVSMGDVAASGGYYISCGADSIFASPTTLTGSIGVFGIIPNMQGLINEKLGITFDNVKTNENAGYISVNRPLTDYERKVLKDNVEDTYNTFTQKVAKGRDMSVENVDDVGQGRVWSGVDAKKNGLVDQYGGLMAAIKAAAEKAGVEDDYRLIKYPEKKQPLEAFIDELTGRKKSMAIEKELGPFYSYYKYLKAIYQMEGPQARLPYEINIY
ncbi:MAG: signal peptide peptidase SppA, partial [Bacteroidales bacterium]|nr:signal peptide peptidase SppA [Bacteroidales bacterium]